MFQSTSLSLSLLNYKMGIRISLARGWDNELHKTLRTVPACSESSPQLKHVQRETFPFFHTEPVVSSHPGATIHALLFPLSPELTRLLAHRCSELEC